jgi:hypothetical protein
MAILREIAVRRREALRGTTDCRVLATWVLHGRSRIDCFDASDRPAEPYSYALVSTTAGLGCCYADEFLDVPADWIGREARTLEPGRIEWEIALLDALAPARVLIPERTESCDAGCKVKAKWRAEIVTEAVLEVMRRTGATGPVIQLGAVGLMIEGLLSAGCQVQAGDLHPAVVGQCVGGIRVLPFEEVKAEIAPGSVVVLTGMALANGTIDGVLELSRNNGAVVVVYAQTGSSFAQEYLEAGVECVIAERFPFYTMAGLSRIHVYTAR